MILEKWIWIKLNTNQAKYFEKLGYSVLRKKNHQGKLTVPKNSKLFVKVSDLKKGSNFRLTKICDICKKQNNVSLIKINEGRLTDGHDYCKKCAAQIKTGSKLKLKIEFVKQKFNEVGLEPLFIEYKNSNETLEYRCKKCGNNGKISYINLKIGKGCSGDCKKEKIKKTSLNRYGVDNYTKTLEYKQNFSGKKSPHWNSKLTEKDRIKNRNIPENGTWRRFVYERDNYTCQVCDKRGYNIVAHHLEGWNWDKENRFNVDNGVTLCVTCHKDFHDKYGRGDNTKEQFKEYMENK